VASLNSEMKAIVKGLAQQGCVIKDTAKGWMVYCPNGEMVSMHKTPSDHRALRNARSRIKRAGLTWPLDK
jgi:hypothetical protein